MIESIKRYAQKYLGVVIITAPVTVAIAANNVKDAFREGKSVMPEVGLGMADVATCGAVTVGRCIKAVVNSRKVNAPATPAAAAAPTTPVTPATPEATPAADHLTSPVSKAMDEKPADKVVA